MSTRFDQDMNVSAKRETRHDGCTNPVQSQQTPRYLSTGLRGLGRWITARIKAHEDRMISLRVCRQDRLDGGVSDGRKDA